MVERSFIEWDKDDIDALGILKIDILALGMLTCIHKCFDLIEAHYGQSHTLASVPQEDPRVYDMLSKGDSVGVFQVESRAQMNMLPRLRPRRFYDLVIEVAIVRPGPIQGDMVHPYLRRRSGEEPVEYPSPCPPHDPLELKNILGRTLGVPIFQEQAMKIAIDAAKFSPAEANESAMRWRHSAPGAPSARWKTRWSDAWWHGATIRNSPNDASSRSRGSGNTGFRKAMWPRSPCSSMSRAGSSATSRTSFALRC